MSARPRPYAGLVPFVIGCLAACAVLGASCITGRGGSNYEDPSGPILWRPLDTGTAALRSGDTLRVVTFNVRFARRIDEAVAILGKAGLERADLILLQEMDSTGVKEIARRLDFGYVYVPAVIHRSTGRTFGPAILARDPITARRKILLPHADPDGHRRVAAFARIVHGVDSVDVVSVHLGTRISPIERADQVQRVLGAIGADRPGSLPIIVGGDFNTFNRRHALAVQRPFGADRFDEARGCADWTYAVRILGIPLIRFHFDRIFARDATIVACGRYDGRQDASDHWPVWADIALPPAPAPPGTKLRMFR
jgi:endonuclease/exonuclease/phosphatase family metal-dependent hydrolase